MYQPHNVLQFNVHPSYILTGITMYHTTRVFKNGNSQAVRIPAALAYEHTDIELGFNVKAMNSEYTIARQSLSGVLNQFAQFSPDFLIEGRGTQEQVERDVW